MPEVWGSSLVDAGQDKDGQIASITFRFKSEKEMAREAKGDKQDVDEIVAAVAGAATTAAIAAQALATDAISLAGDVGVCAGGNGMGMTWVMDREEPPVDHEWMLRPAGGKPMLPHQHTIYVCQNPDKSNTEPHVHARTAHTHSCAPTTHSHAHAHTTRARARAHVHKLSL